jgi:transposase
MKDTLSIEVNGVLHTWRERRLLVQSLAAAHAAGKNMQERIKKAQQALEMLTARRQGKARLTERTQVEEAITVILGEFRVQGLLHVLISEHERVRPVRAYRGRLREERREITFTLIVTRDEEAITEALSHLNWRVYATNQEAKHLSLEQAVEVYRDEYLVERNFSRLKGHPLSLTPLYVQRDDHRIGLVRLLTLALRVLTLLEGVARRRLAEQHEELAGLFAGNPKRRTAQPTAERLLEAFSSITLTAVSAPGLRKLHVTPLSSLQQQILTLLGFSPAIYVRPAADSSFRPTIEVNGENVVDRVLPI